MNACRLVVFDWEGTLADTIGDYITLVQEAAMSFNLPAFDPLEARQWVALGLNKALLKIYPALHPTQYERLLLEIQKSLVTKTYKPVLTLGAEDFLKKLKASQVTLAIASNKGESALKKVLKLSGLDIYFDYVCSASSFEPKPSPQMMAYLLEVSGTSPANALMIGDSLNDIEMANSLKVEAYGIDTERTNKKTLLDAGARFVFNDFVQLSQAFFSV